MVADSTTPVTVPGPGTYRIDPQRSKVSYTSRHMFGLGTVHAEFTITSAEIRVAEVPTASTVVASLSAASFTSNSARRDRDVKSGGLLDVATYPEITFTSGAVREVEGHPVVEGTVTAHGSTVDVEVTVLRAVNEADGLRVQARAEHLDRYAFGITGSKGMVGRYFDLDFDVLAVSA